MKLKNISGGVRKVRHISGQIRIVKDGETIETKMEPIPGALELTDISYEILKKKKKKKVRKTTKTIKRIKTIKEEN